MTHLTANHPLNSTPQLNEPRRLLCFDRLARRIREFLSGPSTRWVFAAWLISRLILLAWGAIVWGIAKNAITWTTYYFNVQPITQGLAGYTIGAWQRWDVIHYINLAQVGYGVVDDSVFFPLFPLLGKLIGLFLGGNNLASLWLISNLALLAAMLLLYTLVEQRFEAATARKAILLLLVSPGAFFFFTAYPHALQLLLGVLLYHAMLHRRWFFAALLGLLAGLTHSTALSLCFLIAALAVPAWWRDRRWSSLPILLTPLTPPLGIALFLAWRIHLGLPDLFLTEEQIWGRHTILPWQFFSILTKIPTNAFYTWINLILVALTIILVCVVWKKAGWQLAVYLGAAALMLNLVAGEQMPAPSFFRYILPIFPFYIGLGLLPRKSTPWFFAAFLTLQFFFSGCFIFWAWVS